MILLDTDHLSVVTDRRDKGHAELLVRLSRDLDEPFLPVVAVEEQLQGWLSKIHRQRDVEQQLDAYDRLVALIEMLVNWPIVRWTKPAAEKFKELRRAGVRIGPNDLKIASLAITNDALLLTRNARDFSRVPGLRFENWLD